MSKILIAVAIACLPVLVLATTIDVHPDGSGTYPTIQSAIDAAQSGDTIRLADGVFSGPGNRDITIDGKALTITSASGDSSLCVIDFGGSPAEPHFGFVVIGNEGLVTVFEAITMTGGWLPARRDDLAAGAIGGGALGVGELSIRRCVFLRNEAGYGGAIGLGGGSHVIEDCLFLENRAPVEGGAIYTNSANFTISDCIFDENWSPLGGALFCLNADGVVERSTFVGNSADPGAGVIYARTGSDLVVANTIIAFNFAPSVWCQTGSVDLSCSDLFGNPGYDYGDCIAGQLGVDGNIREDPLFCTTPDDRYSIADISPCAPEFSDGCGLIGARPVACETIDHVLVNADGTGDFATIAAAIAAVPTGTTIRLADGVYTGSQNTGFSYQGKSVKIESESGDPSLCILDAEDSHGPIAMSGLTAGASLAGVTVRRATGAVNISDGAPIVQNCVFEDCYTTTRGGAIRIDNASPFISGCEFAGNSSADRGGAIAINGGAPEILESVFRDNVSGVSGGAIFCLSSTPMIESCTLVGNSAAEHAGGIWGNWSSLTIVNTIVAFSSQGEGVFWNEGDVPQISCTDIYGNAGGDWVGGIADQLGQVGNIAADPQFCDLAGADLHLSSTSPCAPDGGSCGLIGAWPVGCDEISVVTPSPLVADPIACGESITYGFDYVPAGGATPIRSYSIRITASEQLAFDATDIAVATLPENAQATWQLVEHGPGDWSVDYTILGADTEGITTGAELFAVTMHGTADGEANVAVAAAELRDLLNQPVPVVHDQIAAVTVMCSAPGPVTDAMATPAHEMIHVVWQDPDHPYLAAIDVFRARDEDADGNSSYPLFGRLDGATEPVRPATRDDALADPRWTLIATVEPGVSVLDDPLTGRGIYRYELFPRNGADVAGPPADDPLAATNYILGDCMNDGDGAVDVLDVSLLGAAYATVAGDPYFDPVVDFGPTSDATGSGLPLPDGSIDFEDLAIIGLNFGIEPARDAVPVVDPVASFAWVCGDDGRGVLRLVSGAGVKAVRLMASDGAGGAGVAVSIGELADAQAAPVFLRNAGGGLDAGFAVLGRGVALTGAGDLIEVRGLDGVLAADDLTLDVRGVDGSVIVADLDGVVTTVPVPEVYALSPCYPNPFNPVTRIRYSLPEASGVKLAVYGLDGRLVCELVDEVRPAGVHEAVWRGVDGRGRGVASGTYFCRMDAGEFREVRKMVLAR